MPIVLYYKTTIQLYQEVFVYYNMDNRMQNIKHSPD